MKVRVGIVGAGGIGNVHLENLAANQHVTFTALCDVHQELVHTKAAQYNANAYVDYNDMIENEQLDALFICVPPFAHGEMEEKAAAKGIHLFVEKPIGLDLEAVKRKAEAIEKAGIFASTGYCLRYWDVVEKAKKYLQDKQIAMVRGSYLTKFVEPEWWRKMHLSGGQLVEQATHTLDLMRYFTGNIQKIYANMALLVMNDIPQIDIPDVSSINIVFESGAIGHLDTTFTQTDHRLGVELLGKEFRVELTNDSLTIIENGEKVVHKSENDFYKDQDDAFIEAIRTGNRSLILSPYENALQSLKVTLAANESAQKGLPIQLH